MEAAEDGGAVRGHARDSGGVHFPNARGVIIGDHSTQYNYFRGPGRIAGTAYLEQVRDIAPTQLRDRGRELQELTDFCHGDEPYLWWQAGPWAGCGSASVRRDFSVLVSPPCRSARQT
jgi:hypothetical protein